MKRLRMTSLVLAVTMTSATFAADIDPSLGCMRNPSVVGACRWVTGRLIGTNGTPSMRLFVKGSKRVLGILPAEREIVPAALAELFGKTLDLAYIRGEFQFCPFTPSKPGSMQDGCIESVKGLTTEKR